MKARYEYLIRTVHTDGTIKIKTYSGVDQVDALDNAFFLDSSIKKAWVIDATEALIRLSEVKAGEK